jgi:hypothetical protein
MDYVRPKTIVITTTAFPQPRKTMTGSTHFVESNGPPRKRKRLNHLSPDEKMVRR